MIGVNASKVSLNFSSVMKECLIHETYIKWVRDMIAAISLDLDEESWKDEDKGQEATRRYILSCEGIIESCGYMSYFLGNVVRKLNDENKG